MAKKKYIRVQIENIQWAAIKKLAIHDDEMGARALHELIAEYITWEEICKAAETAKLHFFS